VQYLYHVIPPEFKLDEDKYELLDMARKILSEHKPTKAEFVDPKSVRQVFYNIGKDLLEELADYRKIRLRTRELEQLTEILVRYTIGFGLIEVLLQDEKIQDISINSPMGQAPMYIVHQDFDDCMTNIIPISAEAESWASKLRLMSGRPLDEADPILDTEIELPYANARVAVISAPLDPTGLAFSFRRHRDRPWTLPLFIKAKMINPVAAGLLSFLIDGTRTILIAGTRSSGKSSLLSSLMVEIMRRYRIITIEDTLELPTNQLRKLGYNIQSMKVASALSKEGSEVSAEDGIRSTLRLGDSALIIGEVRSTEAKALYEAMRIGAAANVVAGTIHGDSPYGVYDRVVNDIGIPKTSFKATDIIVVANPIRSPDGIHRMRRVLQVTEVRKKWENDPMLENGFVDLMKYDVKEDGLMPTADLINGDSETLKAIAGNVKEFAGNWDAVWENIMLRGRVKEALVVKSKQAGNPEMLEAPFVIKSNDMFHRISERVKEEISSLDSKRIYDEWLMWLNREIKKKTISRQEEEEQYA
jgi:flagellar protein FlaI